MNVGDLLKSILEGRIVLPDFQRKLEWGPEDIRELLVSILEDYFIGTFGGFTTQYPFIGYYIV